MKKRRRRMSLARAIAVHGGAPANAEMPPLHINYGPEIQPHQITLVPGGTATWVAGHEPLIRSHYATHTHAHTHTYQKDITAISCGFHMAAQHGPL